MPVAGSWARRLLDGIEYQTVEHAYQSAKTAIPEEREQIRLAARPGTAKRLGRLVTMEPAFFSAEHRVKVMHSLVEQKFQEPVLAWLLLETGDAPLFEGNGWSGLFWGTTPDGTMGLNWMGRILQTVRESLRNDF